MVMQEWGCMNGAAGMRGHEWGCMNEVKGKTEWEVRMVWMQLKERMN